MQRHLNEARAADGVRELAQMSIRRDCIPYVRAGKTGRRRIAKSVEIHVVIGNIEAWVIEDVEGVHIVA